MFLSETFRFFDTQIVSIPTTFDLFLAFNSQTTWLYTCYSAALGLQTFALMYPMHIVVFQGISMIETVKLHVLHGGPHTCTYLH